ncbi:MAG: PIN domain-containing protein [Candidatus Rokuibacteriota bacterium]
MTGRALIDSNVLVYTVDPASRDKQAHAAHLLDVLEPVGRGVLSTQVLGEFFRVATEKLAHPLTALEACLALERLASTWPVLSITPPVVLEAARGVRNHRMAYWDAQIWATARLNQVEIVLSEDFQDGGVLDGVRFMNPFAASFDLAAFAG